MSGTHTTLLNLATFAAEMDIMYRLEKALAGEGNMIVFCIKNAIESKQPAAVIIKETKMMIEDNSAAMVTLIGKPLCERILKFKA